MKSYGYQGPPFTEPRSHPWLGTPSTPQCTYYDLTATPALIRSALEDFVPWSHYPAIDAFYSLLEWLNRADSPLESNDCAFTGPEPDEQGGEHRLQCSGRVMLLFRALELNRGERVGWLENRLHRGLAPLDPAFEGGAIGTAIVPVRYRALPPGDQQLGHELMISFWAWGDSEAESMLNLRRVVKNLSSALRRVSAEVASAP